LGLTASSLTFTTIISIVPLFTVALAIFSVFPMFAKMQTGLQQLLVDSLIPDNIARQVLSYLGQFATKASKIGWVGALAFLVSALMLILTIDGKLNDIWRVRKTRHLARRVIVYWTLLTLGPLLLALSLSFSSYVLSASKGWVSVLPGGVKVLLDVVEFIVVATSLAAMYRFVPNTQVRWAHALLGGVFAATGLEARFGMVSRPSAHHFSRVWRICHRADFVDLDLCGLGDGFARCRCRRVFAQS
jgi:membrane protein